jgi:hypothetical protein
MKLKRILSRALAMGETPWWILLSTLQLSCVLLFLAFVILVHISNNSTLNVDLLLTAQELTKLPAGLLLLAVLASAILEDIEKAGD